MFSSRSRHHAGGSFAKHRIGKDSTKQKRSFKETASAAARFEKEVASSPSTAQASPSLTSAIITLSVGPSQRLFAAHEDVLCHSPFFQTACRARFFDTSAKRINLPDDEPEVFSSVLEYLYKGDYYPRLEHNRRRNTWQLEDANNCNHGAAESTVYMSCVGVPVLKDTAIYCTAERYGLDELKRLALRKQGLQSGIQCSTILASARFAYANTPDSDSKLRAHYLALIIRSRHTFKRSGTMQNEVEAGGKMFFDLFVAMVNHMDDITSSKSPH
ncbi:hypothetical protein K490DRAFT_62420 [Saccharata proteae CBS 121410]|uniref:BTB domain-containing protein n=1 Tax=Saccharata proteae CBS 121410 TaxID=1314787 RepID=A0A9P4M1C6_9PEZI|nr:hypothetical protein K490DRAFT_62420 [Saccharata proteae CBS 121410]